MSLNILKNYKERQNIKYVFVVTINNENINFINFMLKYYFSLIINHKNIKFIYIKFVFKFLKIIFYKNIIKSKIIYLLIYDQKIYFLKNKLK